MALKFASRIDDRVIEKQRSSSKRQLLQVPGSEKDKGGEDDENVYVPLKPKELFF